MVKRIDATRKMVRIVVPVKTLMHWRAEMWLNRWPIRRLSSSAVPYSTTRSQMIYSPPLAAWKRQFEARGRLTAQAVTSSAQKMETIPTQDSSWRMGYAARMMMASTERKKKIVYSTKRSVFDGVA